LFSLSQCYLWGERSGAKHVDFRELHIQSLHLSSTLTALIYKTSHVSDTHVTDLLETSHRTGHCSCLKKLEYIAYVRSLGELRLIFSRRILPLLPCLTRYRGLVFANFALKINITSISIRRKFGDCVSSQGFFATKSCNANGCDPP